MKARIVIDRFEDARALVRYARRQLPELCRLHEEALETNAVSADLRVETKVTLDVLRSALDYCAQELFVRFGAAKGKGKPAIYFPISHDGPDDSKFSGLVEHKIPGLRDSRPDLVSLLASFQEFASLDNAWLARLSTLCNTSKHDRLTGERIVEEWISVAYTFHDGAEGRRIPGLEGWRVESRPAPEIRSPLLLARTTGGGRVTIQGVPVQSGEPLPGRRSVSVVTATGIVFRESGDLVVPFIEKSIDGVGGVVEGLASKAGVQRCCA